MPSLTYAELAEALKITPAMPTSWRAGSAGLASPAMMARLECPYPTRRLSARPALRTAPAHPPDNPVHSLLLQVARLEGELAGVREALGEARGRADAAEARSAGLSADLIAEKTTTAKVIAAMRPWLSRLRRWRRREPSPGGGGS
jgi:hypothetical protein